MNGWRVVAAGAVVAVFGCSLQVAAVVLRHHDDTQALPAETTAAAEWCAPVFGDGGTRLGEQCGTPEETTVTGPDGHDCPFAMGRPGRSWYFDCTGGTGDPEQMALDAVAYQQARNGEPLVPPTTRKPETEYCWPVFYADPDRVGMFCRLGTVDVDTNDRLDDTGFPCTLHPRPDVPETAYYDCANTPDGPGRDRASIDAQAVEWHANNEVNHLPGFDDDGNRLPPTQPRS